MKSVERLFTKTLMREHRSINARVNSEAIPKAVPSHTIRRLYPHCSEDERADLGTRLGDAGDIGKHHHHVFSEVETEAVALKEDPRGK